MRKISYIAFALSLTTILFFGVKHLNKPNDIDYLQSIILKIEKQSYTNNNLYYFSNSKEQGLFFKTQFAFVPKIIIRKNIEEISKSEMILLVIDKKNEPIELAIHESLKDSETLFFDENNRFKLFIIKK